MVYLEIEKETRVIKTKENAIVRWIKTMMIISNL